MPNVNLIANLITFHAPESIDKYISELYATNPETIYSFISKRFFLWIALLGITYIIARETRLTKKHNKRLVNRICYVRFYVFTGGPNTRFKYAKYI